MLPVPFPFSDGVVRSINSKWKLRQVLLNLGMAITRDGVLGTCTRVQVSVLGTCTCGFGTCTRTCDLYLMRTC